MSRFKGHFEGASTFLTPQNVPRCARDNLRGQKSLGPLKMSLETAQKVIVPQKKIMSRSFLNSVTLIVILSIAQLRSHRKLVFEFFFYCLWLLQVGRI